MTKVVSPSNGSFVTIGQAVKFADQQTAALRKSGLPSDLVQQVLETQAVELTKLFVDMVRERVEARTGLLIHTVDVNRTSTPQAMLEATGCVPYVDSDVVATMPRGEGDKVELCFFQVPGNPSDDDLASAYDLCGLAPADPFTVGDFNAANREFADKYPNATQLEEYQWKILRRGV